MQQPMIEYPEEIAGHLTRVLEIEGDGPPVLLLHGFGDSADSWRMVLDRMSRAGRRAMAIDLPGFGACASIDPEREVLPQLDEMVAEAVIRLAEETGQHVVVAGNSLGGCASLRAAQNPELPVASIAPIAPAGFDHPVWFSVIERDPILRTILASPLPIPTAVMRASIGRVYRTLAFSDTSGVPPQVMSTFASHMMDRSDLSRIMRIGKRLLPELRDPFELDRIDVPVLLIWGNRDRMVTHRGSRHILAALPEARYEMISGCGHCPQLEAPDRVVDALLEFAPVPA
ncbi:MAG: alpha/beta fold hydrolase [Solirubrobacteraceae bacterium]|nr:alpha/beta fold hydrolase [Solirubrobacteraceae bacterium]